MHNCTPDRPMALPPNSFLETIIAFLLPYFIRSLQGQARSPVRNPRHPGLLRNPHQSGNAAGSSHHRLRHDHPRRPRRGQNRRDVTIDAPPLPRLRQQPQSLHPADRKGARPASRPTNSHAAPAEMPEPVDDMRQAEIMAAIQQYKAKIDTQRPRAHPATGPHLATRTRRGTPNSGPARC